MRYLLIIFLISPNTILGQPDILPGYKELLQKKFIEKKYDEIDYSFCDELLDIIITKENPYALVVPIHFDSGDTVVFLHYQYLIKYAKKNQIDFISNDVELKRLGFEKYAIDDLQINTHYNMDSIFQFMESKMSINTSSLDIDKYIDADPNIENNICIRNIRYVDTFSIIYYFFIRGVILGHAGPVAHLLYVPY